MLEELCDGSWLHTRDAVVGVVPKVTCTDSNLTGRWCILQACQVLSIPQLDYVLVKVCRQPLLPTAFACSLTPTDQPCSRISNVRDLIIALREVSDWRTLGENLGTEPVKLDAIDEELEETEHKKRAVLRAWFEGQSVVACWEEVIRALQASEKDSKVAKELADKFQAD